MSSSRHIDRICLGIFIATIILTLLFTQGLSSGLIAATDSSSSVSYENYLFDTSYVHTIDLVIDDVDAFFEDAESEEYVPAKIVIDGTSFGTVAVRAKGNTSLSNVKEYGNDRYSLKVEFDHYDEANTYYGLDKLNLNNLIQDNTLMKDYLIYTMMADAGADSPLVSYVNLSINGEVFGLYLAVEGIEDGFMDRLGLDGNLYKPDSQTMNAGGGDQDFSEDGKSPGGDMGGMTRPDDNTSGSTDSSDSSTSTDTGTSDSTMPQMPDGGMMPGGGSMPSDTSGSDGASGRQMPDMQGDGTTPPEMPDGQTMPGQSGSNTDSSTEGSTDSSDSSSDSSVNSPSGGFGGQMPDMQGGGGDMGRGNGGMNSADLKLQYIDDDIDSYSNIFDQAKMNVTTADKERLIESLKKLSDQEDLDEILDIDELISYFAVHVFSENGDSYTGSMIHNYYLYEDDGKLSMIPWDYNLAFGGFQSSSASDTVNAPIDSPVDDLSDRPMIAWIFSDDTYTDAYHQALSQLADKILDGTYTDEVQRVYEMILPYVEEDPTKFVTTDEFTTGVETLKEFLVLRAQSIKGQVDGTIPSTSEGQAADSSALIDASSITISDMGSMNAGGMGGGQNMGGGRSDTSSDSSSSQGNFQMPGSTGNQDSSQMPDMSKTPSGGTKGQQSQTGSSSA